MQRLTKWLGCPFTPSLSHSQRKRRAVLCLEEMEGRLVPSALPAPVHVENHAVVANLSTTDAPKEGAKVIAHSEQAGAVVAKSQAAPALKESGAASADQAGKGKHEFDLGNKANGQAAALSPKANAPKAASATADSSPQAKSSGGLEKASASKGRDLGTPDSNQQVPMTKAPASVSQKSGQLEATNPSINHAHRKGWVWSGSKGPTHTANKAIAQLYIPHPGTNNLNVEVIAAAVDARHADAVFADVYPIFQAVLPNDWHPISDPPPLNRRDEVAQPAVPGPRPSVPPPQPVNPIPHRTPLIHPA
jgi:hypothetical protein